jgi:hypothetical protein
MGIILPEAKGQSIPRKAIEADDESEPDKHFILLLNSFSHSVPPFNVRGTIFVN